ncbi:hypothetical protein [Nocardia asteroides]|uniref:hypothetical protein n=1 Tax=Nocardia asteroides TaxID=1824 RepID=UPI001E3D9067|nr:hypothetical protein [Nocardia asteroides]UGT61338.1 hypothetical protein LTT61_30125 [Nocardia asteroides]
MEWTGFEAIALKNATRRSIREFAADLGVGQNTVTKWSRHGGDITLRPVTQRVLDEALARADEAARARFAETVGRVDRLNDPARWDDSLAGQVVNLDLHIDLRIDADNAAEVTYRYETLNMTDRPVTRMVRELWFKHTDGGLRVEPLGSSARRVAVQRIHDTANLVKFACLISPPIQPGETAAVGYRCSGGRFLESLYWRQSIYRHTRHFRLDLRHAGAGQLVSCAASEEHPDGSENSAADRLIWDHEDGDVVATLRREHLRPNQSVTLRWEVARAHS